MRADLLRLKQPTARMMRKYQGELFIVIHSDTEYVPRYGSEPSKWQETPTLNKFEVISGSR